MRSTTRVDLYLVLGVPRSATAAELRHAYRRLALQHHPDRAGASHAEIFSGIADAYRVLSDPVARSAYDASVVDQEAWDRREQGDGQPVHTGGMAWTVETNGWKASRPVPVPDLLTRVSGRLHDLIASRIAALADGGTIDLYLNRREAIKGGTAAIQMTLNVLCATCGGVARPRGVWCRSCEHAGQVSEDVTVLVRVPARTHPGTVLQVSVPRSMDASPRFRIFARGLRPFQGESDDRDADYGDDE